MLSEDKWLDLQFFHLLDRLPPSVEDVVARGKHGEEWEDGRDEEDHRREQVERGRYGVDVSWNHGERDRDR